MMKRIVKLALLVAVAVAVVIRILKGKPEAPTPLYPDFFPRDFEPEIFEVRTEDGLTLRGKRYANPGGMPAILVAGFAGNGFNFDLAFEECNFALGLARRGYDVWIGNFRGTGRAPYKSDHGGFRHHIQDLCAFDMPALVSAVTARTGHKPYVFGHSMGGVVCYGYLQGATYDADGVLTADPELAAARNAGVMGVVSLAGPASFYYPKGERFYLLLGHPVSRFFLRVSAAFVRSACRFMSQVPIERSVTWLFARSPGLAYLLARAGFHFFGNMENMTREMLVEAMLSGMSDVSYRQQFQLLNALVTQDLVTSAVDGGAGTGEGHNVTANMDVITAPVLFVAAEQDAVRPSVLMRDGYSRVSSATKGYRNFDGCGHVDLILGLTMADEVLPFIADWMDGVNAASTEA